MRVLFLHAVEYLEIGIPQGISLLCGLLREHGHCVAVADTTFMKTNTYKKPTVGATIYKPTEYDIYDLVENDPVVNVVEEIQRTIDEFQPDLFAVATMTTNHQYSVDIVEKLSISCPVIYGGVHSTICPEEVISLDFVDMVCIGEGDLAIPLLCDAIEKGEEISEIPNLWIKKNGTIIKNELGPFVELDTLPLPDWSVFDERHLFRPFDGEIYVGGFFVTSRGCPGKCTYCLNEALQRICSGCGKYFRRMSPTKIAEQIKLLKEKYGATWYKFGDDTFLLHTEKEFDELCSLIKPLKIKFGCSVRPDTVTEKKVALLKEMGCVAMSVGIETGNENLRREHLNRQISNAQIRKALSIISKYDIRISTFNMLGLPGETRENVYETIRLNKELGVKAANVYVIYPFPKSILAEKYNVSIMDTDGRIIPMSEGVRFNFSNMSREDILGLQKTFNLRLTLPESLWGAIDVAENDTAEGKKVYDSLLSYAVSVL